MDSFISEIPPYQNFTTPTTSPLNSSKMPSNNFTNYVPNSDAGNRIKMKVVDHGVCRSVDQQTMFTGKVLQLTKFHFKDASGKDRFWEGVEKVIKNCSPDLPESIAIDKSTGVVTIPILRRQIMCDCLVLVKQFRAQLKSYTLEFPATIMDMNTNPKDAANKEIQDDTGYTSTAIKYISPPTSIDPGIY